MSLNACCNLFILIFQTISITSECQGGSGLFCSSIRKSLFSQFYRIIFIEYLTHVFNVMSNLSYICYSINRLFLVGKDHSKFVTRMSKLKLKTFLSRTFLLCLILPIAKMFSFLPNFSDPSSEYPYHFESLFSEVHINSILLLIYLILSIIYTWFNFFGFIIGNLVVDINLLLEMRKVIAEKEKKAIIRAIQSNETQKK